MFPKVSIIILNWNGKEDTIECLESLKNITYPNYEILMVDNGSTDGSVDCFRERYPEIEIIENGENLGFAEGNNVAVKKAVNNNADYVLLLNNDTKVHKNFLTKLVNNIDKDSQTKIAQSKVLNFEGKIDNIGMMCDMYGATIGKKVTDRNLNIYNTSFFYPSGACMLIKTDIIRDDLFDRKLFAYHEDVDLGWQARLQNYNIICVTNSICYHKGSAVFKNSPQKSYFIWRNRLRVLIKNYSTKNIIKRVPVALLLEFLSALSYTLYLKNTKYIYVFLKSLFWNIKNLEDTVAQRKRVQALRKVNDGEIEKYMGMYSLEVEIIYKFIKSFISSC